MKRLKYLLLILLIMITAAAGMSVAAFADTDSSKVTVSSEVFKKVSGTYQGFSYDSPITTDGLSISISVEVASGSFGYLGINSQPGGRGQPVSSMHGIGILLYNSMDACLAVEVYSGYAWQQFTATTEIASIAPSDTITLSMKKEDGVWGIYINGTLFTGMAKDTIGNVAAGSVFNPVAYIDEAEFSDNGKSYIEIGTWDRGGSVTLFQQTMRGSFQGTDCDGEPIEGLTISGAYNAAGNIISVLSSTVDGTDFSVSTLSGDTIEALQIETAGGVKRTILPGETFVIKSSDKELILLCESEEITDAQLRIFRNDREITQFIKIHFNDGKYILEDIAADISVSVVRNGFEDETILIPAGSASVEKELTPKAISVQVQVLELSDFTAVETSHENLHLYKEGNLYEQATVVADGRGYRIEGLSGNLDAFVLKLEDLDGYIDADISLKNAYNGEVILYTTRIYDCKITLTDENGEKITGAHVFTDSADFSEENGVYCLASVYGEFPVSIEKEGYAMRAILVSFAKAEITVVMKAEENLALNVSGVEDGTLIQYTVNGLSVYEAAVSEGKLIFYGASIGDRINISASGYIFEVDSFVLGNTSELIAERIYRICVKFTYNSEPVRGATVYFDRTVSHTDDDGCVYIDAVGEEEIVRIDKIEGYLSMSSSEFVSGNSDFVEIQLSEKIYTARVTLQDAEGNTIRNKKVKIGDTYAEKDENGVYYLTGLSGENKVTVEGTEVSGIVTEQGNEIVLILSEKEESVSETVPTDGGCSSSIQTGMVALSFSILLCVIAVLLKKRKTEF
mgnify:CR=1 FL=1